MAVRLDGQYVTSLDDQDDREKVIAIAPWDAQDEYQLSFDEGEIITILDKFEGNPVYDGWVCDSFPLSYHPLCYPLCSFSSHSPFSECLPSFSLHHPLFIITSHNSIKER